MKPVLKLLAALSVILSLWLVCLPWAANRPAVADHIDRLEQNGVDASAMYYTDLEMMKPVFTRLALQKRQAGNASRIELADQSTTASY